MLYKYTNNYRNCSSLLTFFYKSIKKSMADTAFYGADQRLFMIITQREGAQPRPSTGDHAPLRQSVYLPLQTRA